MLFHHAARVQELELPPGTESSAHTSTSTEEGPEADYWVWEDVPPEKPQPEAPDDPILASILTFSAPPIESEYDDRQPTLQLDIGTVEVHEIKAVAFTSDAHPVRRHRSTKGDTPF